MTEKELHKLNRAELLEMLIAQGKKLNRLEEELKKANSELERREIAVETSGTLAEAALKLNRVFEDADAAAKQYLELIKQKETAADEIIAAAREKADGIIAEAREKADGIIRQAEKKGSEMME